MELLDLKSIPELNELMQQIQAGDEIVLTRNGEAVSRIVTPETSGNGDGLLVQRVPGLNRGWIYYISDDF